MLNSSGLLTEACWAAAGAYGTDRWLLAPVVLPEQHFAGLTGMYRF
ncbi:hypothetical protein QO202_20690 [Aeromonas caviae]|nr:hypothetical protein [Aeromonas caviae]MDN6870416.1 hypothetical protein [Aeromonas caviae]